MLDSDWGESQPGADDENAYLERHSWDEYAEWHLGLTEGANDETKARYAFVFGDFRRIHRTALIACVLPRGGVAPQGDRAGGPRPAPAARPQERRHRLIGRRAAGATPEAGATPGGGSAHVFDLWRNTGAKRWGLARTAASWGIRQWRYSADTCPCATQGGAVGGEDGETGRLRIVPRRKRYRSTSVRNRWSSVAAGSASGRCGPSDGWIIVDDGRHEPVEALGHDSAAIGPAPASPAAIRVDGVEVLVGPSPGRSPARAPRRTRLVELESARRETGAARHGGRSRR